jgi:hypothetical protein
MSKDEIIIKQLGDWKISASQSEQCLYINTSSYHPFNLKLSRDDLRQLLEILDGIINNKRRKKK